MPAGRNVAAGVGKTACGAVDSGAANRSGVGPDDLGHVAPNVEVAVVESAAGLAVVASISVGALLTVVEELGDDSRDVVGLDTSSDVLAVSATVHGPNQNVSN